MKIWPYSLKSIIIDPLNRRSEGLVINFFKVHTPDCSLQRRTSALLNIASVQISNFKHKTVTGLTWSVIYNDEMDIMEQATTNFLMRF